MARILAKTKDMPREEWLAYRRKGIGGSDAAKICMTIDITTKCMASQ